MGSKARTGRLLNQGIGRPSGAKVESFRMGEERRRQPRASEREAQVACTSAEHARRGSSATNLAVRLLDTSATGACLVTTDRLREGSPVIIGIILPKHNAKVMSR